MEPGGGCCGGWTLDCGDSFQDLSLPVHNDTKAQPGEMGVVISRENLCTQVLLVNGKGLGHPFGEDDGTCPPDVLSGGSVVVVVAWVYIAKRDSK